MTSKNLQARTKRKNERIRLELALCMANAEIDPVAMTANLEAVYQWIISGKTAGQPKLKLVETSKTHAT